MRFLHILIIISVVLNSTFARCKRPRGNPMMGALQSILSPVNAERTMQMLKMATQRTIGNAVGPSGNSPIPVQYSPSILPVPEPCNLPVNLNQQIPLPSFLPNTNTLIMPNIPVSSQMPVPMPPLPVQLPNPMSLQMPTQMPLPNQVSIQLPTQLPVQMPAPMPVQMPVPMPIPLPAPMPVPLPPQMPVQLPSPPLLPCQVPQVPTLAPMPEVVIERPSCACQREIVYPSSDLNFFNPIAPIPEVNVPIALTSAQDIYSCPIPSPAALFSLPAASPGSGWTQENMPSCTTSTRSQYLRKIPIPPPTL